MLSGGCLKRTKVKTKTSFGALYVVFSTLKSVKRQIEEKQKAKTQPNTAKLLEKKWEKKFPMGQMPLESI